MSEEILEKYCQFILNKYEPIRSLGEHVALTMKDYMPLQLGEERERLDDKRRDERGDRKEYHEDFRVWREAHTTHKEYSIIPVEVWKAIRNKRIVVKGDPGSGKTTLTQYVAYTLCTQRPKDKTGSSQELTSRAISTDLFPLVVDLKDWAGKSFSLPEYYTKDVLTNSGFEKEIETNIYEWLESGKCIILFDGLDEVTQERKSLIHSLRNLKSGAYRNCHFVVTTRIVGYGNELSGWQHYEIMSLEDEHIRVYVRNYLGDEASDFLTALKNTPQMVPLSKNPLLLHVLCFVFKKQRLIFPTQRIELYHQAVLEMLKLRNPAIPGSIKENVLKEIAIYFLERKEIFEEDFLRKILRDFLKNEGERHNEDDVLKELVEKSGLLCRFGDGRYIFLHLTFQEYMAACYIAEKIKNPLQLLEPVLFNPRFREVIRHTAGMLGSAEDIIRFVEFILEQKPLCHEFLHQPLLLAGLSIADIPENKINPALEELGKQIVDKLWKLWSKTQYDSLRDNINCVFTTNIGCKWARIMINNLLNELGDKDSRVNWYAAKALGNLGRADHEVVQALLKALRDGDFAVRWNAAWALGNLGRAGPEVIQVPLKSLRDEHLLVRERAAESLGRLGRADPEVIQALLKALRDEEDSWLRERIVESLGRLGRADQEVIQALLKMLRDEDSSDDSTYSALQRLVDIKLREGRINLHPQTHPIAVDDLFHGKEEIIKRLTRKFPVYFNRTPPNISENDIKEWLLQFGKPSQRDLAITLLENIDYYGPERMKEAFCHFCDNILPKENKSKVIISLLGSLKDSASNINYTIAEKFMDRNMEALSLETILEKMNPEEKVIVFVDDIIASGKQAVQIFREWLGNEELELEEHHVEPLNSYQIEKFKKFKIYLFFFVGFEDGKQDALKNLRGLGLNIQEIYSLTKLETKVGCFHGASKVFSNDNERKVAERMAREIGIQLFGDKNWSDEKKAERSLGYGNSQKLIVFFYKTPTATLPILWKEGTYNGKKWAPLFPRREKK